MDDGARHVNEPRNDVRLRNEERCGIGVFLYLVLLFTLGIMTLRNGHGRMFFFPLLWLIGAFLRLTRGVDLGI